MLLRNSLLSLFTFLENMIADFENFIFSPEAASYILRTFLTATISLSLASQNIILSSAKRCDIKGPFEHVIPDIDPQPLIGKDKEKLGLLDVSPYWLQNFPLVPH